jgi:hypothetical protein
MGHAVIANGLIDAANKRAQQLGAKGKTVTAMRRARKDFGPQQNAKAVCE